MGRFRLGYTSLLEIHRVEKSTNQRRAFTLSPVSWFSEQCKSNAKINYRHIHRSHLYFKHGIGWHTTQYGKGYCQRYDDFQGNNGHFIGDWLNIVYRYFSNTPRKLSRFPNERSLYSSAVLCLYFKLPSHSLSEPYAPWQWHITL